MKYKELFSINIKHDYFSKNVRNIFIIPSECTQKLIAQENILVKKSSEKVQILVPEVFKKGNQLLEFYVLTDSSTLKDVTKISNGNSGTIILFSNEGSSSENQDLKETTTSNISFSNRYNTIGKIEIDVTNIKEEGVTYNVNFEVKGVIWKYYFVSNPVDQVLKIITRNDSLTFEEVIIEDDALDLKLNSLKLNFPKARISLFQSKKAIPYKDISVKDIQLILDDEPLIQHLPNPKINDQGFQVLKII